MECIFEKKKVLRKSITARVKLLPGSYRAAASESIAEQVLASKEYCAAKRIFLYIGMPTEPDTAGIIRQALADGKAVYVPKCVSKTEMLAVRIQSTNDLAPGAYGIPEPTDLTETIGPDAIDLILVPCVSAWKDGRRLGHGAGYYDRFLEKNADKTFCLCFRKAMSPDIPMDGNDVFMHRVIFDPE